MQPIETITRQPAPAEALLQAAWDKNSEQVQGIIGSHISQTLCPHIGMTCAETRTNLRARFGTLGVSKIAADMYVVYSMKLSSTHRARKVFSEGRRIIRLTTGMKTLYGK